MEQESQREKAEGAESEPDTHHQEDQRVHGYSVRPDTFERIQARHALSFRP